MDAAYGGFAVLTERGRTALSGIERADSIVLDPHKWLYQTFEVGCLLVKNGALLERASTGSPDMQDRLLVVLLDVDREPEGGRAQEASLRGVRKAQLKLTTYYLAVKAEAMARRVWEDMRDETADRLLSIRDELLAVQSKDFWEISDRGGNFEYMSPQRKEMLRIFFTWFREVSGELKAVSLDTPGGTAGRAARVTGERIKGSS